MNKRIEELKKEAFRQTEWEELDYDKILEKFAELIVKECGVALSPMLRDMISRGQAFDLIKKHFGVD